MINISIKEIIKNNADRIYDEIIAIRKHLHQNPELSFQEDQTADFICNKLNSFGIDFKRNIGGNGILGYINKNKKGKTIALRADMDALPVTENTKLPCQSKNKGVMHACGHDIHMASLLGTAKILQEIKDQLPGRVLLVFQPAEEKNPGGAKRMLEEGIFDTCKPDMIIAQHVDPNIDTGKIGFKTGMYMASADEVFLKVSARGGHAAMPDKIIDTVLIASHIIVSLQQIVSRNANPQIPTVLSFGKILAQGATNVIPNEIHIDGTFRTMDEEWRYKAHEKIKQIAANTAKAMGGNCEARIDIGYPFLLNDEETTSKCKEIAEDYLGADNVLNIKPEMISEDFAFFSQQYPATMFRLGVNKPGGETESLHHPAFNPDEEAIKTAMETLAYMTYQLISGN